uniref:aldolase/citrate lyase family protein n=1 Tax=Marinobacterium profundum TaxID=1714300 RepID=UPI0009E74621|nr:aldolase/citrate lyase family protein [Marinobacterium profundum]
MRPETTHPLRSWLFAAGHDLAALHTALNARPAVLVVDLEEFTPADRKAEACVLFHHIVPACRDAGVQCAIRLDRLDNGGTEQLALIAAARPAAVLLPQIEQPEQLRELRQLMDQHDLRDTQIVPTIETRAGLARLDELFRATRLIGAALLGTGDLAQDCGLAQDPTRMQQLQPSRTTFADLCQRNGIEAIDGPWPERSDPLTRADAYHQDCDFSRSAGFRSRCALTAGQVLSWQSYNRAGHAIQEQLEPKMLTSSEHCPTETSRLRNGGQILMQQLRLQGARRLFMVAGESYLPCIDAFNEHTDQIQAITCRQESGAAYMAEAYGKLTGEPGICFVTRGPGATNASVGVHTAYQDSTPMILFIGQVGNDFIEREAFQEIDYRRMFGEMTKWVAQIDRTDRIPEYVARAWAIATSGRPGPVVLALPEDTLFNTADVANINPAAPLDSFAGTSQMQALQQHLENAKKPFLLVGGSSWRPEAMQQLQAFAQRFDLPVGAAWRRLECYDQRDEQFVGHVGWAMHEPLRQQLLESDLIIAVGTRMGEATSEGYSWIECPQPRQTLIHVYPDPEELGRVYRPDLAINASVNGFASMLEALQPSGKHAWSALRAQARQDYLATLTPLPAPGALSLDEVSHTVNKVLDGQGCVTVGAGNYALYPHRYVQFAGAASSLASTVGTMGYGLPAAISYKLENPDQPVVCFAGDGCFQMNMQELGVALQYNLGIVVLVFNNGMWGTIRAHQEREFPGREIALRFQNPEFARLIEAYGGMGKVVTEDAEFEPAFRAALQFTHEHKLPAIIELRYDSNGIAPGALLSDIRDQALAAQQL